MSILNNSIRVGNFTSSNIHKLMTNGKVKGTFGAPALTYIKEKNYERRLGRTLEVDKSSRATLWGKFLERRVHDLLPLEYETCAAVTLQHPEIDFWCGSPDNKNSAERIVGDTKCYEPKAFCEYVDCLSQNDIDLFRSEFPKEYWQLVSNACILGYDIIEPIVYMPYESENQEIRDMASNSNSDDYYKYYFISSAPLSELAYLPDNGFYKNLNRFRFEIPQSDKDALTEAVLKAGKQLITAPSILLAEHKEEATIIEKAVDF